MRWLTVPGWIVPGQRASDKDGYLACSSCTKGSGRTDLASTYKGCGDCADGAPGVPRCRLDPELLVGALAQDFTVSDAVQGHTTRQPHEGESQCQVHARADCRLGVNRRRAGDGEGRLGVVAQDVDAQEQAGRRNNEQLEFRDNYANAQNRVPGFRTRRLGDSRTRSSATQASSTSK